MGDKTGINWTDATWNPVRGCSRVSEGCRNCYAERMAARFCKPGEPYHGFAQITAPRDQFDRVGGRRNGWTRKVALVQEHLADPLHWRKSRRIFTASMSDVFHEELTNEEIAAIWGVMAACPQHTFQVLTKRARRMREWFAWVQESEAPLSTCGREWISAMDVPVTSRSRAGQAVIGPGATWPLPNVWIGVSVENQAAADERIPDLLATPAAVRFLSCEPLLGPIRLQEWTGREHGLALIGAPRGLHWVISGCESGPGARPCQVDWLRSLRDQCSAAGIEFWLKQAEGATTLGNGMTDGGAVVTLGGGSRLKRGGVIDLPYLDGVQHTGMPGTHG